MPLQIGNYTNKTLVEKVNSLENIDVSNFVRKDQDETITGSYTFNKNVTLNGTPANETDAVNKKFVEEKITPISEKQTQLEEKQGEIKGKVTQLETTTGQHTTAIDEINTKISTISEGVVVIGTIEKSKQEVTDDSSLLDNFVRDQKSRAKRKGDLVITNDNYNFYYNGTSWVPAGIRTVDFASTTNAGIVKLGTEEGQLEKVDNQGLVKVKGFAELKTQSDGLKTKLESDYYAKTEIDTKVSGLEEKITSVKSSFKVVTSPSFTNSDNTAKGTYQYTITGGENKLIEVFGVYVNNATNSSLDRVMVDVIAKGNDVIVYSDVNTIAKIIYIELDLN